MILTCEHCGRDYTPERYGRNKYCSRGCKAAARTERGDQWISHKRWYYKTKYGITIEQYDEMRATQGGACAICKRTEPVGRKSQHGDDYWLHVDHDHNTGRVRGLLCGECNVGIGKFRDDPSLLWDAVAYVTTFDLTAVDFTP